MKENDKTPSEGVNMETIRQWIADRECEGWTRADFMRGLEEVLGISDAESSNSES